MFRPIHLSSTTARRSALVGAGLTAVGVAAAVATAPSASAADLAPWVLHHKGTITTHLKTLNTNVTFAAADTTTVPLGKLPIPVSSAITTQTGHASLTTGPKLGNLKLAAFEVRILPQGPATGTFDPTKNDLELTQNLRLQITKATALGLPINLISGSCTTSTTTLKLSGNLSRLDTGQVNLFGAISAKGQLTIPKFSNCGILTPLLNTIATGSGNAVTVDLQPN
ncbi:hypothetical protein ATK17_1054 [Branchiibius hedensis]|uniref:Uncharacterized protein n=1 Tax=Branchiibius hedensis TaxID=672460 RepID=A0A2Y9BTB5_9MICO|nr:hypothetical protein [Branchiibius hedensis]PWJ24946.1 hypothetical protein ATK17_1054 [Branchiibius hedensis]SSA33762.1 hypothetical protein SAMN04489750_1054 [Branchiibius hedensis]